MLHKEGEMICWACITITFRTEGKEREGRHEDSPEKKSWGEMDWDLQPKTN